MVATIFLADQAAKRLFFIEKTFGSDWLGRFVRLTQHKNTGIGFDFPLPPWMILAISVFLMIAVVFLMIAANRRGDRLSVLATGVILGGALGNFYDRVVFGFVRDWLLIGGRSVVNIGDAAILFGALWLFFSHDPVDNVFSSAKSADARDH